MYAYEALEQPYGKLGLGYDPLSRIDSAQFGAPTLDICFKQVRFIREMMTWSAVPELCRLEMDMGTQIHLFGLHQVPD